MIIGPLAYRLPQPDAQHRLRRAIVIAQRRLETIAVLSRAARQVDDVGYLWRLQTAHANALMDLDRALEALAVHQAIWEGGPVPCPIRRREGAG